MVFIAATNNTMPLAQFEGRQLVGGILKDLGDAITQRLGRRATYVNIPSKRVWSVLMQGEADGVCYVMPSWAEGTFDWSRPLIPDGVVLAAHHRAPVVRSLAELANQPVGTVLGYHYPEVEAELGPRFIRDDAPTMEHNLKKLTAGRRQYGVVELTALEYRIRNDKAAKLRADVVFFRFKAHCAFSKRSQIPFARVERAINALHGDGTVDAILDRYR